VSYTSGGSFLHFHEDYLHASACPDAEFKGEFAVTDGGLPVVLNY
jgi:hypothetical protein